MPNRATVVEMSPTSHVVTIPTFSFHHHHHARLPPPLSSAPATAHVWANPGRTHRCHITPTTTPTVPPTMPLNTATSPANYARRRRHVTPMTSQTMTRHPDDVPNNATSWHCPSSATTATSLPNGNSRRWGQWGRMDRGGEREGRGEGTTTSKSLSSPGSFVDTRGDGGQGTTTGYVVVPRSSWWRQGGTYVPLCSYPRHHRQGLVWIPHAAPHLTSFTPLIGGVSSPALLTTTGAACALHAAPFLFFTPKGCFPLFWGDSSFFSTAVSSTGAVYDPPTPLLSFPSIYQGFFLFCPLLCT